MLCISDIPSHDVHLKTNLMWLSVDKITEHLDWWELCWTVLQALCPGPSMWMFNTLILSIWVRFSVGPCPHVSLHWSKRGGGLLSVEILESPWPFYPMVMPKPHWNLFLRWLRKAPKASDRGRGTSFFSSVAPTTQLLSKEPEEQEKDREA